MLVGQSVDNGLAPLISKNGGIVVVVVIVVLKWRLNSYRFTYMQR